MASSGVEIASSSPFGCVLRDRNHRDAYRESSKVKATHGAFQRNIKNFVMDHLNTCISMSSDSQTTNENKNEGQIKSNKNNDDGSTWVSKPGNNLAKIRLTRNSPNDIINNKKDESSLASLISPRHSQLLDRWAAKQAREMVSTLEKEAELLSIDNANDDVPVRTTSSTTSDECSSEIPNLGASSLVQIWEKRLNKTSGTKPNTPMEKTSPNGGTSATCNNENVFVGVEQRGSEIGECLEGQLLGNEENDSSFPDWESDKTGDQGDQGDQSRWCSSESDRVSVADIIKKLTATTSQTQSPSPYIGDENDNEGCGGNSSVACSPCKDFAPELSDQKVTCSPRIRGRLAFTDLFMQLEKDRHGELKNLAERGTVSKFTQRGRIQALLRHKSLQRGVAANILSDQKSTSSEVSKLVQPQGSAIMQLREKFINGVEQRSTVEAEVVKTRNARKVIGNNIRQLENSSTTDQLSKDASSEIAHGTTSHAIKTQNKYAKETSEAAKPVTDSNVNEKEEEETSRECNDTGYDYAADEEGSNQNYAESSWEEMVEENYDENSYDWFSEISRPRSYWEERRQAWYKEMQDTGSPNDDIQVLLQRRTVSTFLSSDFREKMDRLMHSHKGTQTHFVTSPDDEIDNEALMEFFKEHLQPERTPRENKIEKTVDEEEEMVNEQEEEEEEKQDEKEHEEEQGGESLVSDSYHEVGDYSYRSSSWSYRDNEAGDDFDRIPSTSSQQPFQSPSFYHENTPQNSSPINHHSIEMEIIYDMRGHMEQLYQEMSELRKSIKSCMDMHMQMQLQEKKSHNKADKKGNCCVCNEMKADSVFYRCGHMCACLKCANELQWKNGKCPVCRAKIDDVIRVHVEA
ncbi:unnamed protein product [Lathyrus sativus]|nr:unnamed protein product [Lathyrus sativus]